MRIGELSDQTGVSTRALRYCEKKGLIQSKRLHNGYREYSATSIEQVKTIRLYLRLGFTTGQIESFLFCVLKNKEAFCEEIFPMYEEKIKELDGQIKLLTQIKSNLKERTRAIQMERQKKNVEVKA